MRQLILVVHTSLDGFVAGPKGELDGFDAGEENLQFVCSLTEHADAALFGRRSYELLNSGWPQAASRPNASKGTIAYSNWYNNATKIVLSRTMSDKGLVNTVVIRDNISDKIKEIKKQPGKDILIFGSPMVSQELMRLGLIDSYWVFINPVVFGNGIPLFSGPTNKVKLELVSTRQFSNGEFALNYVVIKLMKNPS